MPIDFNCPNCGRNYKVADSNAGKRFACKDCGNPVEVPAAGVVAAPPAMVPPPPARGPAARGPRLPGPRPAGPRLPGGPRGPGGPAPMRAPGPPRPYGQPGTMMGPKKTSAMAITSMIMVGAGLLLFVLAFVLPPLIFLSLLCPLLGVIFGIVGMVQTKKGGKYKGFGLALAGTIINGLGLLAIGAMILFTIILVASVTSDPEFRREMQRQQDRNRGRGFDAPIHRTFQASAHPRPDWALFP